jgi:hypothetical protein
MSAGVMHIKAVARILPSIIILLNSFIRARRCSGRRYVEYLTIRKRSRSGALLNNFVGGLWVASAGTSLHYEDVI